MPKPRPRAKPKGSDQAKQQAQSPTRSYTWIGLDGNKRTFHNTQANHYNKHGFLTLQLLSDSGKKRYKASAERSRWPVIAKAVEHDQEGPGEGKKPEQLEAEVSQEALPSGQLFRPEAHREALEDLNLVGPVHGEAAVSPERYAQQTQAQASPEKHIDSEATSRLQQPTSTHLTHQPQTGGELESQSGSSRARSPVDLEVAKKEVEGLLSSVNQPLDTASKSALDQFLKESTAKQSPRSSAPRPSRPTPAQLETLTPFNHLVATRAQLEEVDSITKRLHRPLRVDTSQAINTSESELQGDNQNQHRGLKRSRTPEPPSLTSGAPSASETPDSPRSRSNSVRPSPARPRGRPPKVKVASSFAPPQKIVTFNTQKLPHGWFLDPTTMAPIRDASDVSNKIKDVIQNLYDVQSQTHGFVPETQALLIDKMAELTQSLSDLQRLTDRNISPNNPVQKIDLAPEIVDYVDDGRNPDIFTRDFVELVQRGNAVVNGKKQAFRDFSQVYAKALKEGIGGVETGVDVVMENAGIEQDTGREGRGLKENGEKG